MLYIGWTSLFMQLSGISPRWAVYVFTALLFALSLFTVFGERGVVHLWRLWEEKKRIEERNFRLRQENEILRERIYRLRHDNLFLEKIAREELGLIRPGEIVYRFASSESRRDRGKGISGSFSAPPRSSEQKSRR